MATKQQVIDRPVETTEPKQAQTTVANYDEAYKIFTSWRPATKQRQGSGGMMFDYLPVQEYEHFLDDTVGPGNWETLPGGLTENAVGVILKIFGVSKTGTAAIWPAAQIQVRNAQGDVTGKRENPQPNEVEKAAARAFRRAAAQHGMLRYLWEKGGTSPSTTPPTYVRAQGAGQPLAGSNGASRPVSSAQLKFLSNLGVPSKIASALDSSTASKIIDVLSKQQREDRDAYMENQAELVEDALSIYGLSPLGTTEDTYTDID